MDAADILMGEAQDIHMESQATAIPAITGLLTPNIGRRLVPTSHQKLPDRQTALQNGRHEAQLQLMERPVRRKRQQQLCRHQSGSIVAKQVGDGKR